MQINAKSLNFVTSEKIAESFSRSALNGEMVDKVCNTIISPLQVLAVLWLYVYFYAVLADVEVVPLHQIRGY